MAKITVYQCGRYNITTDEFEKSKCLTTKETAERYDLAIQEETATEVDESELNETTHRG